MSEPKVVPAGPKRVPNWGFGIGVALVLIAAFIAVSHTTAFKLATTHQPERFTELYFTRPNDLPASAKSGDRVPVAFTLHNVEAQDVMYTYQITFTDAGGTKLLLERQLSIADGQKQPVTDYAAIPAGTGKGELSVILLHNNKSQTIHFWLERK